MVADQIGLDLDWAQFTALVTRLASDVGPQRPDVVVGILRGGMIPAVLLAHRLGLRTVRAVEITHTTTDGPNATKTARPAVVNPVSLGDLTGRDVLIVDDVAGSGDTLAVAVEQAATAGAGRVRTAVCVVNELNWRSANDRDPHQTLTYVGVCCRGWVRFPWETQ